MTPSTASAALLQMAPITDVLPQDSLASQAQWNSDGAVREHTKPRTQEGLTVKGEKET